MGNHSNINNQFIPYELALELKELGFNEPCFAIWSGFDENNFSVTDTVRLFSSEFSIDGTQSNTLYINPTDNRVSAPLWQQAFDWFREEYNLFTEFSKNTATNKYDWCIPINISKGYCSEEYDSYEETRLECLKKLIELVKNKQS